MTDQTKYQIFVSCKIQVTLTLTLDFIITFNQSILIANAFWIDTEYKCTILKADIDLYQVSIWLSIHNIIKANTIYKYP